MYERDILKQIEPFLGTNDILLFYGARQVGKTTLMRLIQQKHFAEESLFFDLENPDYFDLLNNSPELFISFLKSYHNWDGVRRIVIFIDEIQYLTNPTNFLKYIYDNYSAIKLIVSGSSTLEIRGKLKDSLVGRLIKFEIYPLSFKEFLHFKEKDNLANAIGKPIDFELINNELRFYYEEFMTYGSYPKVVLANDIEIKKAYLKQIHESYIQKDIKDIGRIREVDKFNRLVCLLANQSGNLLNISELSRTIAVSVNTINEWLFLLENTFVVRLLRPFSGNLRNELTKMPKLYFIDNGLRNSIINSFETTGSMFENSFYAYLNHSYRADNLFFYRTQDKKEIDFVANKIPYELKTAYNGSKQTALDYFCEQYKKPANIVTLQKQLNNNYNVIYPWEM